MKKSGTTFSCRICGGKPLEVLDLGRVPLAGDFKPVGVKNETYPLAIDVCEHCLTLQVREPVAPTVLFKADYAYASSTIPALAEHFRRYAESVALPSGLRGKKQLLEIGCNDGIFLQPLVKAGYRAVGIDASDDVARAARAKGLSVITGFFGNGSAQKLLDEYGSFDVITCSNVFAHNPDVNGFMKGVMALLSPRGEFWVEVHSAYGLHQGLQWDCFYHEHCYYWNAHSLSRFMEKCGLRMIRCETTPMHGGALRLVFSRKGEPVRPPEPVLSIEDWMAFRQRALRSREIIQWSVSHLPIRYAYGAAGRAVILINWTGIADKLRFMVDGSPLRYGKAIPNTAIPIISEEEFFRKRPESDICFVTAHNYLESIRRKVENGFARPFFFATPLPDFRIS